MIKEWLSNFNLEPAILNYINLAVSVTVVFVGSYFLYWIMNQVIPRTLVRATRKVRLRLGAIMLEHRIVHTLMHFFSPALVLFYSLDYLLADFSYLIVYADRILHTYLSILIIILITRSFNALKDYLESLPLYADKPLDSFFQLAKIVVYIVGGVVAFSLLLDQSPLYFFSALGAASVVLILAFKDTILGFVASIQLSSNDMLHIGDWVTVDKYGADGEVVEINLTTIKVRNWDNTITTIPTYAFISDSFKNWQGMLESGGRRIKRSILVNVNSVRFCTPTMLQRYEKIQLLQKYIQDKRKDIASYNTTHKVNTSMLMNGRNLTNVGCLRAYMERYIQHHPFINTKMTFMVRQLPSTEKGLPLEVYAFSKEKAWIAYEGIMSDIFDHFLAVAPTFDIQVMQQVTGADVRMLKKLR